jgi:hypothetical protein
MTGTAAAVLAHQGGWDELLFVLVPIVLFAGLLAIANRRASRLGLGDRGDEGEGEPGDGEGAPDPPTRPG